MIVSGGGAVIANKRRRDIKNKFINAGAVNIKNAKKISELDIKDTMMLEKMIKKNIIVQENDKYYLNEKNSDKEIEGKHKRLFILLALAVLIVVVFLFMVL